MCVFKHDNIVMLYGVPVCSIDQLPKKCVCGATITYGDEVCFVEFNVRNWDDDNETIRRT
jgi:hypothetical protein